MKVLVVGTVPPPGGPYAYALAAAAGALVAEGHDVEMLSPDLASAAHHSARLEGAKLALHLALLASRYDALVLRIEDRLPCAKTTGRFSRALALGSLGASLRLWKDVTLRLDTPVPIPGGLGGRASRDLWANATCIVVANEDDRDQLLRAPGVVEDRVVIEPLGETQRSHLEEHWPLETDEGLRDQVLAIVRASAKRDRELNAARRALGVDVLGPIGSSSFTYLNRPSASAAGLARLVAARAKRIAGQALSSIR